MAMREPPLRLYAAGAVVKTYLHLWCVFDLRARLDSNWWESGAPRALFGCYVPNDLSALSKLFGLHPRPQIAQGA